MRRYLLSCSLILVATAALAADDARPEPPELITDRPDATESAAVVTRGYVQVEMGWTHAVFDVNDVETVADSLPELEWQETMNKGRAVFRAVEMAEAGLDRIGQEGEE